MLRFALPLAGDISMDAMRTALINHLYSRQSKQQFLVRITDNNSNAALQGKEQDALALLKKFAIEQDQLFYQSNTLGRHQQLALSLVKQNKAFICLCTPEEKHCGQGCVNNQTALAKQIKAEKLPYTVRICEPDAVIVLHDKTKGEMQITAGRIGSPLLLDTQGIPSDSFASACDDMLSGVSTIIEHGISPAQSAVQIHMRQSMGYTAQTEYAHLSTLGNATDPSITQLLEAGFLPDAIINLLLSTGIQAPAAYFTLPDALNWFDFSHLQETDTGYDLDILRQLNKKHLLHIEDKQLSKVFGFADTSIGKLLKCYLEETETLKGLDERIKTLFAEKPCHGTEGESMRVLAAVIQEAPMFDSFVPFREYLSAKSDLDDAALALPLRLLMTGRSSGPELAEIYPHIKSYITEIARCTL